MTMMALTPRAGSDVSVAALAGELLASTRAELPALVELPERERLLVATWLVSLRSARTRRAYFGDLAAWLAWLGERHLDPLSVGRVQVDMWVRAHTDAGAKPVTIRRRLAALSGWYRYLAAHDVIEHHPVAGVVRPWVDPDHSETIGLDRDQARALLAAADADTGRARLRTAAALRVLLHNSLRVDELCQADVADLGHDKGHRVLTVARKGHRRARMPLAPSTWDALEAYLVDRAHRAGLADWRQLEGPLLATATGGRLRQSQLWELIQRLAKAAGIESWARLSVHSLRHTGITLALDAGATLRDVQDYAGHRDPRTTRRYDRSRHSLDRSAVYTVAAYLA
jgi:integrase/recombinase XerD